MGGGRGLCLRAGLGVSQHTLFTYVCSSAGRQQTGHQCVQPFEVGGMASRFAEPLGGSPGFPEHATGWSPLQAVSAL